MTIQPKTTYRGENDSGQLEVRKSFAVERSDLKVWTEEKDDGTEVTRIEVPVSSPSEDRDGDEFSESGLESQADQFRSGTVGMWLDHGLSAETGFPDYRVLEQIGGWKDARIDDDGQLFATGELRPSSEEADELKTLLDEGVAPVGFSVGFIVEEFEEKEDSEYGKRFHAVDLLECSAVGIPSNPDAMVSDSAMAAAKAVSGAGGYDGEPEELAQAITREIRSLPYSETENDEQSTQTMTVSTEFKQSDEELNAVTSLLESYLESEEASEDDPVTEVIQWASEQEGADSEALQAVAEEALSESEEAEALDDLTVSDLSSFVTEAKEDGDGEGEEGEGEEDEEDEEEESNSADPEETDSEGDGPELRAMVRDALKETLPDPLKSEEALRDLVGEEVRDALTEGEFEAEVTDSFVDELRSELFKDPTSGATKPSPAGTISTFSGNEEGEESESNEERDGSENVEKPTPNLTSNQ